MFVSGRKNHLTPDEKLKILGGREEIDKWQLEGQIKHIPAESDLSVLCILTVNPVVLVS